MDNKVLRINLSNETFNFEKLNNNFKYNYIGSKGIGLKIYTDEVSEKINSFDSENKIIISIGSATGLISPVGGRYSIITKTPLNNKITTTISGDYFGYSLSLNNIDVLIIEGNAKKPIYLIIDENKVFFKDAQKIWGLETNRTLNYLKKILKYDFNYLIIGPAAENLFLSSILINSFNKAIGRKGLGPIFGFKKLKAIVINNRNLETNNIEKENFLNKFDCCSNCPIICSRKKTNENKNIIEEICNLIGTDFFSTMNFIDTYKRFVSSFDENKSFICKIDFNDYSFLKELIIKIIFDKGFNKKISDLTPTKEEKIFKNNSLINYKTKKNKNKKSKELNILIDSIGLCAYTSNCFTDISEYVNFLNIESKNYETNEILKICTNILNLEK